MKSNKFNADKISSLLYIVMQHTEGINFHTLIMQMYQMIRLHKRPGQITHAGICIPQRKIQLTIESKENTYILGKKSLYCSLVDSRWFNRRESMVQTPAQTFQTNRNMKKIFDGTNNILAKALRKNNLAMKRVFKNLSFQLETSERKSIASLSS